MRTYFKLLLLLALFFAIGQPAAVAEDQTITICDGNTTNTRVPFSYASGYAAEGDVVQVVYSKGNLNLLNGSIIKKIRLYANNYISSSLKSNQIKILINNISTGSSVATTKEDMDAYSNNMTEVYSGNFGATGNDYFVEYTLSQPFTYDGNDLVIEFRDITLTKKSSVTWLGLSASSNTSAFYDAYNHSVTNYAFLPKMLITYEEPSNVQRPTASVSPESLTFTNVQAGYSATQTVTLTNTSDNELSLVPTVTMSGTNADLFVPDLSNLSTLAPNEWLTIPVTYSPTVADQSHSATMTIAIATPDEDPVSGTPITVALTGNSVQPQLAATATPAEGTIDFGKVIIGGDPARFVIKKAGVTNVGTETWNIPTSGIVTTGDNAFAVVPNQDNTQVLPDGELSFTITFTPTEARTYEGTLSITPYEGRTITWFLLGVGSNEAATQFDNITYQWPFNAAESEQTTSYMSEIATDPDQMIALCRAVYMNQEIPGNWYRGYTTAGETEESVSYQAVGKLTKDGSNYTYDDAYGWDIPMKSSGVKSHTSGNHTYTYMDPDDYKPEVNGVTLLMVEYKDGVKTSSSTSHSTTDYESLRSLFANTFKSVRVITQKKEIMDGNERQSTLFKIDADKLNRFFFLGKGRLRRADYSVNNEYGNCTLPSFNDYYTSYQAGAIGSGPFYEMFEQFSPVDLADASDVVDVYQAMINNMTSYYVNHDCQQVPYVDDGHEFNMYGKESLSDDCQDVRDLMFLVPEKRMMWWKGDTSSSSNNARDKIGSSDPEGTLTSDMFENYHKSYRPTMALFTIHQWPIDGEKKDNENTYQLTLSWHSNLLDFLPGGTYQIYQVINENGVETYVPIGDPITAEKTSAENEVYQYVEVPMLEHGQQVTYVIQAQDTDGWLTMQMSNKQSYIIPGTNPAEMLQLVLTETNSRFEPHGENNYYSNGLQVNAYENQFKSDYLTTGTEFTIWRTARTPQRDSEGNIHYDENNNIVYDEVETQIGTASVGANNTITITIDGDQTESTEFPTGKSNATHIPAGYNENTGSATYTVDNNGYVTFNDFVFYDNFCASTASNNHPTEYVYKVKLTTAVPLNGLPNFVTWREGKTFAYFECKYGSKMWAYAWDDNGDVTDPWPGEEMSEKGTIERNGETYKIWLWEPDENVEPTMILFNWDEHSSLEKTQDYPFTNGGYYKHENNTVLTTITEENTSNKVESNTAHVYIPKTKMEMGGVMSLAQVNADGKEGYNEVATLPDGMEFTIDVKYASRAEILRYDAYRWNMDETETRYIIDEVKANGDEEDIAPNGEADNGEGNGLYTLKINGNTLPSVTVAQGETKPAPFVDDYVKNNAGDWVYAPVVETFGPNDSYNTYGAPLKSTVSGTVTIEVDQIQGSENYEWQANGKTYCYYNAPVKITDVSVPEGYEIYKARAWRLVNENLLGEELQGQPNGNGVELPNRTGRMKGDYLFEEMNWGEYTNEFSGGMTKTSLLGYEFGSRAYDGDRPQNNETMATFGAVKLTGSETMDVTLVVRVYFVKTHDAAGNRNPLVTVATRDDNVANAADFDYYVAEASVNKQVDSSIITGVKNLNMDREVVGVTYVNPMGQMSSKPFSGVNIIVTRYSDGTTSTRKVIQ